MISSYWRELLSVILLIAIVATEPLYRNAAYDYSLTFIPSWQQKGNEARKLFFEFISAFGTPGVIAGCFLMIYSFGTRRLVIKAILVIYITQNLVTLFKVFYHNPRPYLSSDEVEAMHCSGGYGNPSGHCLFATAFFGSMWTLLFPNNTEKIKPVFGEKWVGEVVKWICFVGVMSLVVLTFFARMYLGSHGLNQTIYGILLGLWVVYTFGVIVPRYVDYHYDHFISKGHLINPINVAFVIIIVVFTILQVLNLVLYFSLKDHKNFMKDEWLARLHHKCPDFDTTPFEDSFKGGLHTSLYVFLYFSQIFSARMFPKAFNYWYSDIGILKLILRTLNVISILGLCYLPYFFTKDSSFTLQMVLGVILTNLLIVVVGIPFVDWSSEKLELVDARTDKEKQNWEEMYGIV
eukprot:TRINITY_DN8188_c0_g1_i1.p1 TRINITY_DN8188_c0_g1~~TRINITY_DN8188_c0_g1_i1.p1  ORF type:complete len:406 (+),score=96.70 TRINITY_DN8188_c0_g1_i1:88-1305(+)